MNIVLHAIKVRNDPGNFLAIELLIKWCRSNNLIENIEAILGLFEISGQLLRNSDPLLYADNLLFYCLAAELLGF